MSRLALLWLPGSSASTPSGISPFQVYPRLSTSERTSSAGASLKPDVATRSGFLWINPEQKSLWFGLLDESATVGEFRLQQHRTSWELHVTVEFEVAQPEIPDEPTRGGFDIGESKLLTGRACQNDTPTQPYIYDGGRA